jgi:type II secretory pathway pseudopilin PulG
MSSVCLRTDRSPADSPRTSEQGWALLGLLLALGVMSIVLASSIVPNVQMAVQRDKEIEMIYRGQQVAEGIARYYNGGALRGIQLLQRPPYGYLTELEKLRDGVTIGVNERKFVRPSAMIDPLSNSEWEPVRARDPRIMPFLQAWAAQTLIPIPTQYLLLAAPPTKSVFGKTSPSTPATSDTHGDGEASGQRPPVVNPANPGNPQIVRPPVRTPADLDDDDDDDDDDDVMPDPLAHLFETGSPGKSNAPIIGVAPKRKGKAANALFGLVNYEEWVFIFIPTTVQQGVGTQLPGQPVTKPRIAN